MTLVLAKKKCPLLFPNYICLISLTHHLREHPLGLMELPTQII